MKYELQNDLTFFGRGNRAMRNKINKAGNIVERVIIDDNEHDIRGQERKLIPVHEKAAAKKQEPATAGTKDKGKK